MDIATIIGIVGGAANPDFIKTEFGLGYKFITGK